MCPKVDSTHLKASFIFPQHWNRELPEVKGTIQHLTKDLILGVYRRICHSVSMAVLSSSWVLTHYWGWMLDATDTLTKWIPYKSHSGRAPLCHKVAGCHSGRLGWDCVKERGSWRACGFSDIVVCLWQWWCGKRMVGYLLMSFFTTKSETTGNQSSWFLMWTGKQKDKPSPEQRRRRRAYALMRSRSVF